MPKTRSSTKKDAENRRPRGRPKATVEKGMSKKVQDRYYKQMDAAMKRMDSRLHSFSFWRLEFAHLDPNLVNCWHFQRLDQNTRTLADIGENAVSLVNSMPATAKERTSLRQKFSESILLYSHILLLLNVRSNL